MMTFFILLNSYEPIGSYESRALYRLGPRLDNSPLKSFFDNSPFKKH